MMLNNILNLDKSENNRKNNRKNNRENEGKICVFF